MPSINLEPKHQILGFFRQPPVHSVWLSSARFNAHFGQCLLGVGGYLQFDAPLRVLQDSFLPIGPTPSAGNNLEPKGLFLGETFDNLRFVRLGFRCPLTAWRWRISAEALPRAYEARAMLAMALIILLALIVAAVGGGSRGRDSTFLPLLFCSTPSAPSLP